jgi:hypothetical protein
MQMHTLHIHLENLIVLQEIFGGTFKIQLLYNYHPIPSVIHGQFFNVHVFFC